MSAMRNAVATTPLTIELGLQLHKSLQLVAATSVRSLAPSSLPSAISVTGVSMSP